MIVIVSDLDDEIWYVYRHGSKLFRGLIQQRYSTNKSQDVLPNNSGCLTFFSKNNTPIYVKVSFTANFMVQHGATYRFFNLRQNKGWFTLFIVFLGLFLLITLYYITFSICLYIHTSVSCECVVIFQGLSVLAGTGRPRLLIISTNNTQTHTRTGRTQISNNINK